MNSRLYTNEDKYEDLWQYHHQWDEDVTARRTHKDKIHTAKSLATKLLLPKHQTDRVVGIVDQLNGRRFNQYGGIEALALGAAAYVRDLDIENNEHTDSDELFEMRLIGSEEFNDICGKHGVDGWRACKKVKEIYRKGSQTTSNSEDSHHAEKESNIDTIEID